MASFFITLVKRAPGIEPGLNAWEAFVIPFHHARTVWRGST